MPGGTDVILRSPNQVPDSWQAFGHSWLQHQTGPADQTGRVDSLFRSALDIEWGNWRNYALSGAVAIWEQRYQGGWPRVFNSMLKPTARTFPYAPDGGGNLLCYGINDLGRNGGQDSVLRAALADTHRAIISRCRASVVWDDTSARFTYGAGFAALTGATGDNCTGTSLRQATSSTSATVTLTLPSDYKGETVAVCFLGRSGTTGGSIAFSGTAGYAGATLDLNNRTQAAWNSHIPIVRRITGLTAANAGQTIIMTATVSASGSVFFDSAWLEALTPQPVLVMNVARLTATGYSNSFYTNWTGTEASKDTDVQTYNALLAGVVAEFDQMVQLVDVDTIIGKDATKTSDGIHPNEYGSGPIVDECLRALGRMNPPTIANGRTLAFNNPSPRVAPARRPRITVSTGWWHRPQVSTYSTSTTYTPVAGHVFAYPFAISEAREFYDQIGILTVAAGTAAPTVRWGIWDDVNWMGYPQQLFPGNDPTNPTAFTMTLSANTVVAGSVGTLGFIPDPGLYWIVLKVETAGTGQTWATMSGQSQFMPNTVAAGTGVGGFCAWQLTGVASGALAQNFPGSWPSTPTATPVTSAPLIQLRKTK